MDRIVTRVLCGLAIGLAVAGGGRAAEAGKNAQAPQLAAHAEGPGAAHAPAGHSEEPNPFVWQTDLALWTGVVFVVLLAILWRFAWGPIAEGLDKREKHIAGQISDAERSNQEARKLLDEYRQKLAGSQDQVRAILEQARRDAEQVGRSMLDKAREESKREQEKAVRQIEQAADAVTKELAERSADLAVQLAGKIVRAKLSPADHASLIREAVANFSKSKPSPN